MILGEIKSMFIENNSGLQQIYQNKLIEGVDYETYDWLKADIPIGKTMMSLPINQEILNGKESLYKSDIHLI